MAGNPFGIDVSALDVPSFLAVARLWYPVLALSGLVLVAWRRRSSWLLLGVLLANTFAWAVTNYPLQRLYALGVGKDRVNNLAFCQVAAAGNSPLDTLQVGYTHFSRHGRPHHVLWAAVVAALSGWNPGRVLALYAWIPLLMLWGFALALYAGLRPPPGTPGWSGWERACVAGGATLLCASPLDFTSPYSPAWSMVFLLKPNHALGLVVFPFVLRACAHGRGWKGRLLAALLIHLLGWAFALHVVYVACGLVVYAVLSWFAAPREERRRDVLDALIPLGLNALLTLPILVRLLLDRVARQASVHSALPTAPHLLEPTARAGVVFLLGAWGAWVAFQRGDRLGRLLSAQWVGALLIWLAYAGLSPLGLVEQPDEIFYWIRILTGALAGVGLWDVARRAAREVPALAREPARQAAALGLVVLPWTLPYWWDPARMDRYFEGSRPPLPALLEDTGAFLRDHTPPRAVIAGQTETTWWMAALAGKRSLLSEGLHKGADYQTRVDAVNTLVASEDAAAVGAAAAAYGVTHLVVTPSLLAPHGLDLARLESRPHFRRLFFSGDRGGDYVAVLEIR
jgi:hypothetical protein